MPRTAPSSLSCAHAARSSAGLLALALLGATLSYPAVARATFYVKASSAVSAPPGSMIQQNTDWLPGVRDTSLQGVVDGVTTYGAVNHAAGDCRVRLGHLVGHASGQTTDDYSPSWCYSTSEGVDFSDHLKVSSNTLPAGTPVTVRLKLLGSPVGWYGGGLAIANSSFGLSASYIGSTYAEETVSWQGSSSSASVPFDFATTVGSSFELVGSLRASVQGYHLGSSAASGECHYYADVLTPGAFLVSESCTDYGSTPATKFASEPADQIVPAGSSALFSVASARLGPYTYQWRRNGVALVDGGAVSGATLATLSVNPAHAANMGDYDVIVSSTCGPDTSHLATLTTQSVTGVPAAGAPALALSAPAPNPTRGETALTLTLARAARVRVSVEDVAGRTVSVLLEGEFGAGRRELRWDGRDASGRAAAPGVYRCRCVADGASVRTRSIALVR